MAISDVEVWVDSTGDQTCDLKLTRPWGVTYTRRKHLDGEASFMVTNDDPQVVANLIQKRRRMAIVHTASGIVLYSGRISSYSYVEVDAGEHAGMNTQYGVRDDLGDLRTAHIAPWVFYNNAYRNDLSSRPIDSERHMGWRDPSYCWVLADPNGGGPGIVTLRPIGIDGFSWTPATVLYPVGSQASTPLGRNGNPKTFPTPDTKVIWSRPISGDLHPQGDVWLASGTIRTAANHSGFVFHLMGDDAYEVWMNGTLLAAVENDEADSAFLKTKRVVVKRTSDEIGPVMFFVVRCRNQGPNSAGDIGGFAMICRGKGTGIKVIETDESWFALDYPAAAIPASPVPGEPAGYLFTQLWDEILRKLTGLGQMSVLQSWVNDVAPTTDHAGGPWPIFTDLPLTNGTSLFDVLVAMGTKCQFDYVPTKSLPTIRMWSGPGVPLIGGGTGVGRGTTLGVTIQKGVNAQNIEMASSDIGEQWNEGYANTLVYTWKNGWGEKSTTAVLSGSENRIEKYNAFGADLEQTEVEAQVDQMLARMVASQANWVVSPSPLPGIIPGVDFTIDDKIPFVVAGVTHAEPVVTITGQVDEAGRLTHSIEVGKEIDAVERKYQQFMESVAKGVEFERGAPTPSPFYDVNYVDESQVEYSFVLQNPTETDSQTNQDTIHVQGRVMYLDMRAELPLTDDVVAQLYVNTIPVESITLPAGDLYTFYTWDAGTTCPQGAVIYIKFTTSDTTANVTALLRIGEFL